MGKSLTISVGSLLFLLVASLNAAAQGYVIQSPGERPTFVNPLGNDRYIIQSPGRTPSFANPSGNGGYVIQSPGQRPSFVNPTSPTSPSPCVRDIYGRC
jgi:hypothetical protein